jgi:hypothetical protein
MNSKELNAIITTITGLILNTKEENLKESNVEIEIIHPPIILQNNKKYSSYLPSFCGN